MIQMIGPESIAPVLSCITHIDSSAIEDPFCPLLFDLQMCFPKKMYNPNLIMCLSNVIKSFHLCLFLQAKVPRTHQKDFAKRRRETTVLPKRAVFSPPGREEENEFESHPLVKNAEQ